MCEFIGIEILAANALIEVLEHKKESSIAFSKIEEYGKKVIEILETVYKKQYIILYNENPSGNRISNYKEYFELIGDYVVVKDGITAACLRKKFRAPLKYVILKAFLCENTREIIIEKERKKENG